MARRFTEEAIAGLVLGVRQSKDLRVKIQSAVTLLSFGWGRPETSSGTIPFSAASADELSLETTRALESFMSSGYRIIGPDGIDITSREQLVDDEIARQAEAYDADAALAKIEAAEQDAGDTAPDTDNVEAAPPQPTPTDAEAKARAMFYERSTTTADRYGSSRNNAGYRFSNKVT